MNLSMADLRNYKTEFHETWWRLKILKTQNCSSNGDLSLCQNLCLYHYPVRSYRH
jgi:hypothetical protein